MFYGIISTLVSMVIVAMIMAIANGQRAEAMRRQVLFCNPVDKFFQPWWHENLIGLNFNEETVLLGNRKQLIKYDFAQIASVDVVQNGITLNTTNRGSQLLGVVTGGLLIGGVGALIGA